MSRPVARTPRRRAQNALARLRIAVRKAVDLAAHPRRKGRRSHPVVIDADLARHWERIVTLLLRFGGASSGNDVNLYCGGDELMEDVWREIDSATESVWFEIYTLAPDRVGNRTVEALTHAAQRGCKVLLMYDGVGSMGITDAMLKPLHDAGGESHVFNPLWRWKRSQPLLRRDHRKIMIADGKVGFCGGMNMSEDYAGEKHGNCLFRDCHMRVRGPCVRDLAEVFISSWHMLTKRRLRAPQPTEIAGPTFVQVLASSGAQGRRAIQRALRITVRSAAKQCYITTPYFVPPHRLIKVINRAAERGVDVRILTAGRSDVPIVSVASQHIYGQLLKHGVRIYEMFGRTLHAKTISIDGLYSTVGSFNLDTWSHERNLEVNLAMLDGKVCAEVHAQFLSDLKSAKEVTLETWHKRSLWKRLVHWAAYQLLRL